MLTELKERLSICFQLLDQGGKDFEKELGEIFTLEQGWIWTLEGHWDSGR